jgi:cbb3-type cytochrome oxidase maturation protein
MNIIYLLLGVSVFFVIVFVGAFVFAVKSGQYDDLEGSSYRAFLDESSLKYKKENNNVTQ